MRAVTGTSGWQYQSWKEPFYGTTPARQWLNQYANTFPTVEVNSTFYRLPQIESVTNWHRSTPDNFVFSVKMSRYLTHVKRLQDPQGSIDLFMNRIEPLQEKLGPVLLQLPPNLHMDLELLSLAFKRMPASLRISVEFRHSSWFSNEVRALLEQFDVSLCLSDRKGPITPFWQTTDWGYVRFHEGLAQPDTCYGRQALKTWIERLETIWPKRQDVYVYFNNDTNACAISNAQTFIKLVDS